MDEIKVGDQIRHGNMIGTVLEICTYSRIYKINIDYDIPLMGFHIGRVTHIFMDNTKKYMP